MTEEQLRLGLIEEENARSGRNEEDRYADEDHFNAGGPASTCPSDLRRERERCVLVSPKASNNGGNRTTYNYTAVEHVALVKEVYKEKFQDEGEASPKWKDLAVTLSTMIHKPARVPKVLCQHFKGD